MAHVVDGAPAPEYLHGSPKIVADARQRLIDHGIDPDNRRREGVIGREVVLSASHEFFAAGSQADRFERLQNWKAAQVPFLIDHFGAHRLVSVVLHQDEYTPHVHAIVLALKHSPDRRRGPEWTLAGEVLAATGKWAQDQTAYARVMAPFGLSRGKEKSDNKHKPYGERMTEMDADQNAILIQRQDLAAKHAAADEALIGLRDGWASLAAAQAQFREDSRQAASARAGIVDLLKEAAAAQEDVRAREEELERQFQLLWDQRAKADQRERQIEKRESALTERSDLRPMANVPAASRQQVIGASPSSRAI